MMYKIQEIPAIVLHQYVAFCNGKCRPNLVQLKCLFWEKLVQFFFAYFFCVLFVLILWLLYQSVTSMSVAN